MKGTEKIIAHIEADAKAKANEILAEAEQKCAEIKKQYEEQASELYSRKIREGVKACQDLEEGALRISRMEAKKGILAAKQDMVAKSFNLASERINSLPENDYIAFLVKLAKDAGGKGDEEIILNAKDRSSIGQKLLQALNAEGVHMSLAEETRDITGGLILRSGAVETNCSTELLVEICKGELSSKLADILFQ